MKKNKWLKETFGLPTYIIATLTLMTISNGENLFIVYLGLIPFIVAYNLIYEYLFPDFEIKNQWTKLIILVFGQFIFWLIFLKLLGKY